MTNIRRTLRALLVAAIACSGLATAVATAEFAAAAGETEFAVTPDIHVNDALLLGGDLLGYAVVASTDPTYGNRLVEFNSETGAITRSVVVGSEPTVLGRSVSGARIHVGLAGSNEVVEVETAGFTVVGTTSLGTTGFFGPRYAVDLVVLGDREVVVSMRRAAIPEHAGVAVISDGVLLPDITAEHTGPNVIERGVTADVVGYTNESSSYGWWQLNVDGDGVTREEPSILTAVNGFDLDIREDNDRIYASNRVSIDPDTGATIQTYGEGTSSVRPAVNGGIAYFYDADNQSIELYDVDSGGPFGEPIAMPSAIDGMDVTAAGIIAWRTGVGFVDVREGVLTGNVSDFETGLPVADACVDIYTPDSTPLDYLGTAVTDANGDYSIVLPTGEYWVLFANCDEIRYFNEWFNDVRAFDFDRINEVTIRDGETSIASAVVSPIFTDLVEGSFYFLPVLFLRDAGITTGCSSVLFCPGDNVTREQMASFMARFWRFVGGTCDFSATPIADVPVTSFASDDVSCIYNLGITTGTGPTTYSPANLVTREQMASFIARLWRRAGFDCPAGGHPFTDVSVTSFAFNDVACIFNLGITTGTSATTYSPSDFVTRAQMAAFLDRLFDALIAAVDALDD
ncbi:MAG: S-layer homology domain-containing protein [Actinomycetota bacterium]